MEKLKQDLLIKYRSHNVNNTTFQKVLIDIMADTDSDKSLTGYQKKNLVMDVFNSLVQARDISSTGLMRQLITENIISDMVENFILLTKHKDRIGINAFIPSQESIVSCTNLFSSIVKLFAKVPSK